MTIGRNYVESDSLAILRDGNAISFVPVYLDADDTPFVHRTPPLIEARETRKQSTD